MSWDANDSLNTVMEYMVEVADQERDGKVTTESANRALAGLAWLLVQKIREAKGETA
jgi:hypothetical protein